MPGKRVLTKDLDQRVVDIERKLAELADTLAKLDERITRIANTVAQQQLERSFGI